jgi:H+/Cl- antiporter ClcA
MIWSLTALITYLVLGIIGGTATEQIANRKFWPPLYLIGAILVAFGGGLIGAWFFASVLGLKDPQVLDIPVIPTLVGLIIFMIPWFIVRGGYTGYGKQRTWQRKYRR